MPERIVRLASGNHLRVLTEGARVTAVELILRHADVEIGPGNHLWKLAEAAARSPETK